MENVKADKANVLKTLVGVSVVALVAASSALANPLDPTVVTANVGIIGVGTTNVTINNNTLRSIVNWGDFSIGVGEKTTINQIAPNAAILNRVIGNNVSQIYGQLNSNGQVYLINEHGIVVGASGVVDTNGFVASTLNVSNTDFIGNGNMLFKQTIQGAGGIKVYGTIKSVSGGDVFLLSREIEIGETGKINTAGYVGLGAGEELLLKPVDSGDGCISI